MAAMMAGNTAPTSRLKKLAPRRERSEHTIPSSMAFSYDVDDSDGEGSRDSATGTDAIDRAFKRCQT